MYFFDAVKIASKIIRERFKGDARDCLVMTQDPFETGFIGRKIKRKFGIPLQIQVHTDFLSPEFAAESIMNKVRVVMAKFLIPEAATIRTVSRKIKIGLNEFFGFPLDKIFVLPVFIDVLAIEQTKTNVNLKEKYKQFDFVILMASRLTKEKNIPLAVDAMAGVVREHRNAALVIVGDGPARKKIERKIFFKRIYNNVILEHWSEDLFSYYKTADLFLLTSNYEGYARTVVEAMASGCPVVMTNVGVAGDLVKNGENGIIVPVKDKNALRDAIIRIIKDPTLAQTFIKRNLESVNYLPSLDEHLAKYKESWEECFR
jgi:glycosyltransferase involved in cell wall biosynthesis